MILQYELKWGIPVCLRITTAIAVVEVFPHTI